jgi:hypothetical protein
VAMTIVALGLSSDPHGNIHLSMVPTSPVHWAVKIRTRYEANEGVQSYLGTLSR